MMNVRKLMFSFTFSISIAGPVTDPKVLIEGVLFRARYLGSTQLVCEGQPTKATRMMQAEEAVSRIKVGERFYIERSVVNRANNTDSITGLLRGNFDLIATFRDALRGPFYPGLLTRASYLVDGARGLFCYLVFCNL